MYTTVPRFRELYDLGWPHLVCVIPPKATLSARTAVPRSALGKVPGEYVLPGAGSARGVEGENKGKLGDYWTGMGRWVAVTTKVSRTMIDRWDSFFDLTSPGPSIGHHWYTGLAIDCDVTDKELSKVILDVTWAKLGRSPLRIGYKPKWLMPFRTKLSFRPAKIRFVDQHGEEHAVEILARGRQSVLFGTHPETEAPYGWHGVERLSDLKYTKLPLVDKASMQTWEDAVRVALVERGCKIVESGAAALQHISRGAPDQDTLVTKDADALEALVRATPNTLDYLEWIKFGQALRAAFRDDPGRGKALWVEFSGRWREGAPASPEEAERKWASFAPPHLVGEDWLMKVAADVGKGADTARMDFSDFEGDMLPDYRSEFARRGVGLKAGFATDLARYSDQALARRFAEDCALDTTYVREAREWAQYDAERGIWKKVGDYPSGVMNFLMREAGTVSIEDEKQHRATVSRLLAAGTTNKVENLTRRIISTSIGEFDADPGVLNTPAGVVDLRDGRVLPAGPEAMCMRSTAVAPAERAECPRWEQFIDEVTKGDQGLAQYLQRALGYTLWGVPSEEVVFFLYGPGGNGKGVLSHVVSTLLGDYAEVAGIDAFVLNRFGNSSHPEEIARLAGARMIVCTEQKPRARWDEARLKAFSGQDEMSAAFKYGHYFKFKPCGTLWFMGQDRPRLSRVDDSIERRFRMFTFDFKPARPDTHLKERLVEEEGPGILRWLVDGAVAWNVEGELGLCDAVERANREYFAENDPIYAWAERYLRFDRGVKQQAAEAYEYYKMWCEKEMREPETQAAFSRRLYSMPGVRRKRTRQGSIVVGCTLKAKVTG